jgi:hypothetical protein
MLRKQKQKQCPQKGSRMNTKWVNGIGEERTIKIEEKRNVGDVGGDRREIKRTTVTKVGTNK